jgi:hypothetical protein
MSLGYELAHTELANFMNIGFLISRAYVPDVSAPAAGQKEGTLSIETMAKNAPLERGHIVFVLRKTAPHK